MQKQKIMQLLTQLKNAAAILSDSVFLINEMIGESDAMDDVATLRRSRFQIIKNEKTNAETLEEETAFLKFTEKELLKMPKGFRRIYKLKGGNVAHVRRKENGTYEIRYRRDGFNLSVSAKTVELAKERFIEKMQSARRDESCKTVKLAEFATEWLDVVKRPAVKDVTYKDYQRVFRVYVFPKLGNVMVKDIKPMDLQRLLTDLSDKELNRTAQHVYVILKALFEFAVAEELMSRSPMALIRKPKHETKHGSALTLDEEKEFLAAIKNYPYRAALLVLLFTGIRRSELATVEISEKWITVTTSKTRKGIAAKKRKIPISPKLTPFIRTITKKAITVDPSILTHDFPTFAPTHHLHDLRHTFITRCQERGIARELVSVWVGHKADNTMTSNVYTHFSDEFQLSEAKKLDY